MNADHKGVTMTAAPLRARCLASLVLVTVLAIASLAAAAQAEPARPSSSPVLSRHNSVWRVSAVQCPCNPDLPRARHSANLRTARVSAVQCPCNPDLPRQSGVTASPTRTRPGVTTSPTTPSGKGSLVSMSPR